MEAIKRNLLLLTSSHNVKPTKSLLAAWTIAIDFLSPEQIETAAVYCMRKRNNPFMPTTAEFIEISERLEADKAKEERINQEIEEENRYLENPIGKEKVKEITSRIASEVSKIKPGSIKRPEIVIYEFMDTKGNVEYYQAFGFIEFKKFEKETLKAYGAHLSRVSHVKKRFKKIKHKDTDGKARHYMAYVTEDQPKPDSTEFTVGYP